MGGGIDVDQALAEDDRSAPVDALQFGLHRAHATVPATETRHRAGPVESRCCISSRRLAAALLPSAISGMARPGGSSAQGRSPRTFNAARRRCRGRAAVKRRRSRSSNDTSALSSPICRSRSSVSPARVSLAAGGAASGLRADVVHRKPRCRPQRRLARVASPGATRAWDPCSQARAATRDAGTRPCACRSRSCRRWRRTVALAPGSRSRASQASSPCPTCRP